MNTLSIARPRSSMLIAVENLRSTTTQGFVQSLQTKFVVQCPCQVVQFMGSTSINKKGAFSFKGAVMGAEKNLLRRFVKGDEEAFNLLYSQYQQVIRNRIRNYTKGRLRSEIDDICQHFWLNLVRYAQSYDQTKPVENWLISCAVRSIYHYKQRNAMQEVTVTNIDAYTPSSSRIKRSSLASWFFMRIS